MPVTFAAVLERRCPWISRFEGGIFSGREQLCKPDAAIYEALERRYALDAADTLFLDDSPANVAAARARGWQAELIDRPERVATVLAERGVLPI
jgi:putative hydrolase of the HAD superfamily